MQPKTGDRLKTRFMPPPAPPTANFSSVAGAVSAAVCCGPVGNLRDEDVVVFLAKKIITMDPSWPEGTAVAVSDGKILSVGTEDDLKPFMDSARSVRIDDTFKDKIIVPGFIDPHQHPFVAGMALCLCHTIAYFDTPNPYGPPIKGVKNRSELASRLEHLVQTVQPEDESILTWGYDSVAMGGHLDADYLDTVSTTRGVVVWDCSMHFVYTNRFFLKRMGKIKPVPGVMFGEDGKPNGQFLGIRSLQLVIKFFVPKFVTPHAAMGGMKHVTDLSHQNGITTVGEMMLGGLSLMLELPMYREFYNEPDVPTRCVAVIDAKKVSGLLGSASRVIAFIKNLVRTSTDRLIFNGGAKFFSDDAFLGLTMQLNQPGYIDGHDGIWIAEPETFARMMLPYWKAGLRLHVHSNGDKGNDSTLAALAELQLHHPRFDHRFTFEHYGMSTQAISRKVKALGALCSVNASYIHYRAEINEKHLGTDRAHLASRLHSLVELGIPTAIHTDVPVAPPVPLEGMWMATERLGQSGKVLAPAERVTRHQALRMVTVDASYVLGMDHMIGSIEAGKLADFTILDADPLALEVDLREINVWGTVMGGRKIPKDYKWSVKGAETLPNKFIPGLIALQARWERGRLGTFWRCLDWAVRNVRKSHLRVFAMMFLATVAYAVRRIRRRALRV